MKTLRSNTEWRNQQRFCASGQKHFPIGRNLDGKLGEGGPAIELSTVNGGIRIDRSNALVLENR